MKRPPLPLLVAAALVATLSTAPLLAQDQTPDDPPPSATSDRIATLVIYGDDPCPRSSDDEIVVCAREPESERYRIPKRLRKAKPSAKDRSWSDRVQMLETVSKQGLPNSCSPVGAGGQTGCMDRLLREYREQRAYDEAQGTRIP